MLEQTETRPMLNAWLVWTRVWVDSCWKSKKSVTGSLRPHQPGFLFCQIFL